MSAQPSLGVPAVDQRLTRAIEFMRTNLREPLTAAEVARSAAVSVSILFELFRYHIQETPMGVLELMRMEEAARLLTTTTGPVCEIAAAVGMANPSSFARAFRRCMRASPSEYRRKAHAATLPGTAAADRCAPHPEATNVEIV